MTNVLQKVDIATLKEGDEVIATPYPADYDNVKPLKEDIAKFIRWEGEKAIVRYSNGFTVKRNKFDLYYPSTTTSPEQPVLIELREALKWLGKSELISPNGYHLFKACFIQKENQYQPQTSGDETLKRTALWLRYNGMNEAAEKVLEKEWIETKPNTTITAPLADTPQPTFAERIDEQWKTQDNPFPLDVARNLYKEGGTGKELALDWYTKEQLEEVDLPMKLSDVVDCVTDVTATVPTPQYARGFRAMADLLRLRRAWLNIAAKDWQPNWSDNSQEKECISRWGNEVSVAIETLDYKQLSFPVGDLATRFIAAFPDLLNTAFCLPVIGGSKV